MYACDDNRCHDIYCALLQNHLTTNDTKTAKGRDAWADRLHDDARERTNLKISRRGISRVFGEGKIILLQ